MRPSAARVLRYSYRRFGTKEAPPLTAAGPHTLILTRRYTPTWAIVVGIIGILFFLIGLLAFFVKQTETLTVTVTPLLRGALRGGGILHILDHCHRNPVHPRRGPSPRRRAARSALTRTSARFEKAACWDGS